MGKVKIIIISGASVGIGRFLTESYLKKGHIVIGCSRSGSDLAHACYEHFSLDVSDEAAVKKMVSIIAKKYGRINVLINNAGISSMNHSMLTPLSTVERIFKTNVFGTFIFCREVAKIMARNKHGRIVNFTSIGVPFRLEGESAYLASKSAIEMLTKILAKEYANLNITINAVGPAAVETNLIKNVPENKIKDILDKQALHRFARPEEVLNVVDFFINDKSDMISGQTIYLGGIS